MKPNTWRDYLVSALCYASAVTASSLHKRLSKPTIGRTAQVLSLDFQKQSASSDHPDLIRSKRPVSERSVQSTSLEERATVQQAVDNNDNSGLLYYVYVSIGKPPQVVRLQLGTGSSDIWVESAQSTYCQGIDNPCNQGSFDPGRSSSYKVVGRNQFSILYDDGTNATGDYFVDALTIGGVTVLAQEMGLANRTTIPSGILGIGYEANEAITNFNASASFPGLPARLVQQNSIKSKTYSIWLNDLYSPQGQLLFGGVDTAKYTGTLKGSAVQNPSASTEPTQFTIQMDLFYYIFPNGTRDIISGPFYIDIDVGTSLTLIPNYAFYPIANLTKATHHTIGDYYTVDCDLGEDAQGTLYFSLGGTDGPLIGVKLTDLLLPSNLPGTCYLGLAPSDHYILGDSFLRLVYMVYDLDGREIFMAPTVFNATASNIYEIEGPQSNGVINIPSLPSVISSSATSTTSSIISPTTTSSTTSSTSSTSTSAPPPAKKSIVVPVVASVVPVVAIAGLLGLFFFFFRRRRRSAPQTPSAAFAPQPPPAPPMSQHPKDTWGSNHTAVNSPIPPSAAYPNTQYRPGYPPPNQEAPYYENQTPHNGFQGFELDGNQPAYGQPPYNQPTYPATHQSGGYNNR